MVLLFLMLLALPLASRAKDTFYIEPVNVVPGESKTITLNLDNSQVFRGFQTDIELPEGLKIASRSNGNFDISLTDRGSSSFSVSSNLMSDGSVRILGYSTQGESIKGNQGALVRISVRASSDFSGGYIKLKNSIFSDVNNRDVKLDNSQLFVGTKEQNDVSVKGGEISPEVSKAFSFELSNESEMTAFQMDVVLPNGLFLDLSKTRLTGRCGNHQLQTKQLGNGKVRIICMSSDNTSISGKIGSVIDLWIKAEKGITGNQIVKLENIIFSDVKARTYRMDPFSFVVDVKYVPVTSVSISESNMQLEVSDSRQLTASLLPENCTDKTILWKSDNEKVATVSDNGMIIARSAGQCSIIASTADNLIQAKCVVTVVKIPLTAHVANTTKVYGDANPEFNITYSGFRDGDSEVGFSVPASISTIVDNSSKVGKYDIVASGAVSDKYEISYIPGTLTITKAPLSISAGNYTKKQGDAMPVFKASYAGLKNGENESVLTKQPVFSCEANEASAPAEYAVTISGAEAENYEISYEQGHLTVVEADAVVVRAKSYSRQYGDENPVFEFETEGAALDGTPEIVCSAVANSPVGSYTIEVKQGSIKNYNVHFESGSLVITKAPLSISAGNYTKKQGDAMPVFKASYAGFKNGEDESVLTKQPVFSCEANEASAPAEYAVTISGAEAENYEISYEQGHLTVVEADAVVVRAKSYNRQYGDENPVFEFETEGAALDGTPEIVCSAVANSPVGSYTIEVKQGSIKNYNVHFESGSLVITKAPLSISAGNYTKKQGDAMPVFKASYVGFKNGEDESVLTKQPVFSCEANEAGAPAEYAVTISGAEAENYAISYEQGHLTVVEADAVVVRAKSYSRQYGDENPVFEFDIEGAALDGTPEIVCSAVANSPVGSYTIEVKQGSIKNYNVHFESGTLTITKAPLSISAGSYTKKQGDAMPAFKASYAGFKNGENESVLTKQPVFSCEANEASAPAEYAVTISGAEAENYDISYEQGHLTVVEADAVVVRAKSYNRQYGDENPVFEFETEGAALDGTPEIVCSAVANSPVGSYTIEVKQGSIKNYNVHFESGSLVITKAPLSISAGNYTKKQGDAMPVFKASYAGFKNGEDESVLTKQPVFSCDANEASAPAEYAVTISGADAENYEISYEQGHLTVVEADAVVVRAKSYSRQYGDENPVFEFETDGAALDGTPEIVCSAVANSPVGSYTIEVKQGSIKNYNVHFESGSLVITKAPLSISAGNYTKKQGDAMPVFKASYAGFKNGEDESVLTKQPVFSCDANEASAPAEYAVTISGADAENYDISYEQGVLTVTGMPKPIISTDEATLRITTETDNAVIYYTLDGTEPNENARKYTEPINLYASCEIKAIAVKGDAKSEVTSAEYHDEEYPNIVKVGDIITANIINNGEENLPMIFKVTSVYPFNVEMENKEDYVEGWSNERDVSGTLEIPVVVKSNGISYCVKKLGDNSLARCVNVSSLKLNEGLESIGRQAIRWCRNIKELIVPNSVKEVWGAFLTEDHGLVSVVLGSGLETIHTEAFWGVSMNLKSFISLSTNPAKCVEPDRTFTSLPEDVTLYVPLGSKSAYETAPGWDYFAGHIVEMDMSPATVKVKDCSREYGDDNPTLEFETEGATLIGEPEIICSADKNSKVGTYEIEINKGTIKNYLVTFVPGTLTVTKAPLVVTAENYTITQGDKLPEFTANYSGFKNGEDESVLTKQPVFSCEANEASAPGEYPITVYDVEADNYEVKSYIAGTLTVLKRELKKQTITWDQEIKAKVGSTIEMNATASSGLPVRYLYALAPGVETAYQVPQIEGNKITFPQNGMYLLVAIQDGNNEYAAATDTLDVCAISDDEGLMYIDGIYYKYTDDGSALKVVRGYNPYRGKVEIPATVNGLPVTEVDGLAMYACYYLKELVIGDNVKKCGHEAFGASINLYNVTLPVADVEFTHNWMFNCDRGIREIHCRSSIPYVVDEGIFNGAVDYDKCILYVPVGTKQSYANSEVWKNFTHIVEENVSTNISNINVEKKSVWHTLQGVKLFAKPNIPGVYIHNGKKIIVR